MRIHCTHIIVSLLLCSPWAAPAQTLLKGIVVDSLTLDHLPGVHIRVKNSRQATVSDSGGIFVILVNPHDTLTFSFLGYKKTSQQVSNQEEIMFVRMRDESTLLTEIIIRDTPLLIDTKYIQSPTLSTIRPLKASSTGVNFAYFTRIEVEKRKLLAMVKELEMARAYIEIVNDPEVREKIMNNNSLSEDRYYELLAHFNQTRPDIMYSSDPALILNSLFSYFEKSSK